MKDSGALDKFLEEMKPERNLIIRGFGEVVSDTRAKHIPKMLEMLTILKEAAEFYANEANYGPDEGDIDFGKNSRQSISTCEKLLEGEG